MDFDKNQHMESQFSREKKKALKFLKEAFLSRENTLGEIKTKPKHKLEKLMSAMKVNRLKDTFYKKLTANNIFQSPAKLQLLSEKDKDKKRLIKIKGFHVPTNFLAILYALQMIFMVITFFIASCMAFLDDFVQSEVYHSDLVRALNIITTVLCFFKIIITSAAQRIKRGILLRYVTDIFIDYASSMILFVDAIYFFIMIMLFIIKHTAVHLIEEYSLVLFVFSIIRITFSSSNLTLFRTTFINSLRKDQYYKLFQVIIFNFIFAHFVASILFAMSKMDPHENWMVAKHIDHQVWYIQYMWGYYWATTTMMTVGFGDFLPVTYREGFIVAFLEFFSCIVLAYNISEIGGIISTIRSSQNQYIAKIAVFKRMAQQNEIQFELKTKIQGYLRQQKAIKQKFQFNQQNELLQSLPEPLRKEFIMASNGKLFKYLPFFKNLQKNTLLALAESLSSKVFYPSEILEKAYEYNQNIMILKEGKVGLAYRKSDSSLNGIIVEEIQIIKRSFVTSEGSTETKNLPILLTSNFLTPGKVINYDLTAITYSYVFELSQKIFLQTIKMSNIDTEYFFSLIHQQSSGNQWQQLPCNECLNETDLMPIKKMQNTLNGQPDTSDHIFYHTKFQCPKLHYLPLQGVIIMKYLTTRGVVQIRKTNFHRQKPRLETGLTLRKGAFKLYEKKTFINEKKEVQKLVEMSVSNRSKFSRRFRKRSFYQNKTLERKRSSTYSNIVSQHLYMSQDFIPFNKKNTMKALAKHSQELEDNNLDDILSNGEVSDEEQDENKSMIESVVKYAVQQLNPRNANLHFWNLEIDQMAYYFNYFPQDNAAKLDNVELSKGKQSKVKGLCLIGELFKLKNKNSKNSSKYNQEDRAKQFDALSAFLNIFMSNTNGFDASLNNNGGLQASEVKYKKVYDTQESEVLKEQKEKYLDRYSKFTYQFPRQRMTDTSMRDEQRPSFKSMKKVRFSYEALKENIKDLSNQNESQRSGISSVSQVEKKKQNDSMKDEFTNSKNLLRNYF